MVVSSMFLLPICIRACQHDSVHSTVDKHQKIFVAVGAALSILYMTRFMHSFRIYILFLFPFLAVYETKKYVIAAWVV